MSEKAYSKQYHYQITLAGGLDEQWADWFDGLVLTHPDQQPEITTLTGPVADQAALRGLLNQIWDFNLTLIAVQRLD